jgi:hypothetical protein
MMRFATRGDDAVSVDRKQQEALDVLAATPGQIARITRGRSGEELCARPREGAWSAHEILAHLRACADVWGKSIHRMLHEDRPTIRYVSPRSWIRKTNYLSLDFHHSLDALSQQRATLVATLRALDVAGWARQASFTATTLGREADVLLYARRIGDHELKHLDQLRRTVG